MFVSSLQCQQLSIGHYCCTITLYLLTASYDFPFSSSVSRPTYLALYCHGTHGPRKHNAYYLGDIKPVSDDDDHDDVVLVDLCDDD